MEKNMANNLKSNNQDQVIQDLLSRLDWFDAERRKLNRRLAEMEQKITLQEREISGREQRIKELESQLAGVNAQLSKLPQVDLQLAKFKDEIVQMIEQYDQRRIKAEGEMDRLRRIEQESTARAIAEIRKELTQIPALRNDMELRTAEESRLANLIGQQRNQIDSLRNQQENLDSSFGFLEEREKHSAKQVSQLQTEILEINKKWEPIYTRLDTLNNNVLRLEGSLSGINERLTAIQNSTKNWMEQVQIGEYERNQKLDKWRLLIEEQADALTGFRKEWIQFSDQYKEAKMAVQTLSQWQEDIQKQQREANELLRIESGRLQSRWDDFVQDSEKKWRSRNTDSDQRWATINRHQSNVLEQITALDEKIKKLSDQKDLLWRVQSAQADALKRFPLMWVEEVEKAIAQDPNRRRQPALIPMREELESE
jgi:chromosome segregation ATPase